MSKNSVQYSRTWRDKTMKIIIDEFIDSLKSRQASQNTIASYERDIMQFSN